MFIKGLSDYNKIYSNLKHQFKTFLNLLISCRNIDDAIRYKVLSIYKTIVYVCISKQLKQKERERELEML